MTHAEKKQIEYLKSRRNTLIDEFIGACDEINAQIKEVRAGIWLEKQREKKECLDGSENYNDIKQLG